jgi:hypothetical protein
MPRYFFDPRDSPWLALDDEGVELESKEAAQQESPGRSRMPSEKFLRPLETERPRSRSATSKALSIRCAVELEARRAN